VKKILSNEIVISFFTEKGGNIMQKMKNRRIKADPRFTIPYTGHLDDFPVLG
jgi:hypothetical protein